MAWSTAQKISGLATIVLCTMLNSTILYAYMQHGLKMGYFLIGLFISNFICSGFFVKMSMENKKKMESANSQGN